MQLVSFKQSLMIKYVIAGLNVSCCWKLHLSSSLLFINSETPDKTVETRNNSEPECNSDCECKRGFMCIHHQCKSRSCRMDSDCHKYGLVSYISIVIPAIWKNEIVIEANHSFYTFNRMFCHNSTSECRLRCTHTEFTTEYCECGLHQYCKETDEGSICKCPR